MKHIRLLQGFALFTSSVLAAGAQTSSDPGGLAGPASSGAMPTTTATIDLTGGTTTTTRAATAGAGFAPAHFGNVILTQTPANATGSGGVSTVFSSAGSQFTFGSGGSLMNPADFEYEVTGDNTATLTVPGADGSVASTTNLVFTAEGAGTYTTVTGDSTSSGSFGLATIPSSAPLANLSARTTVTGNNQAIVGFVIAGNAPRQVLIRAVGPSLANFEVPQPLQNPTLQLFRDRQMIATNDSWGTLLPLPPLAASADATDISDAGTTGTTTTTGTDTGDTGDTGSSQFTGTFDDGETFTTSLATADQFTAVGAFALDEGSEDAAFVATLPPGAYTVVVGRSNPAGLVGNGSPSAGAGTDTAGQGTGNGGPDGAGSGSGTGSGTDNATGGSPAGSGEVLVEVYFIE